MLKTVIIAAAVLVLMVLCCTITCVPAGHVGVADRFGRVWDKPLNPGVQLKPIFSGIKDMSIRTQQVQEKMAVPTSEGITATLDVSALYRLDPSAAVKVYKELGLNYDEVIITPGLRNVIRDVVAEFKPEDLYTENRAQVTIRAEKLLGTFYKKYGVILDEVLLRDLVLPPTLTTAIEKKMKADQEQQQMVYTLQKETQEADRKRIEAGGIADFQRIVTQGISPALLRWKGIEATQALAESPNTKVLVIGGRDGLPLIFNTN